LMVDKTLVLKKLASLEEYRNQLKEYSTLTVAGYRADWKVQRIVERTLQMMIELCADIAGHVIADRKNTWGQRTHGVKEHMGSKNTWGQVLRQHN
jgi:uncharacterized protein YutE (UPF0331/DUF86 family)